MLSRVADSIYWMSRYIERAENVARFIDVNLQLMLDLPVPENEQWEPLVAITGDEEIFRERYPEVTQESVMRFLTFDPEYPNSILSSVRAARENARSIREAITTEMWEQINRYYLLVTESASNPETLANPHRFFTQVKVGSQLFVGITDATMSHGEGWHFARMGRTLERADKTTRLLDVKYFYLLPRVEYVGTPFDNIQWAAVLKSAGALEMYRQVFHRISPQTVTRFLIFDGEFPRSVRACLRRSEESLHAITGAAFGSFRNEAERRLGRLRAELDFTEFREILSRGVHEYLDDLQGKINDVGAAVFETFFSTRPAGEKSEPGEIVES